MMGRLPWFPFYPADWFRDTRCLSFAGRGAWADLLGILWDSKTRGTKTLDMDGWAAELGKPLDQVQAVFTELRKREIANFVTQGNNDVTISCRRQVREEKERESTRSRVSKFRETKKKRSSNELVTPYISEVISHNHKSESEGIEHISEVKRQRIKIKSCGEVKTPSPPPKSGATWDAYSEAYRCRYGKIPERSKKINTILCCLVDEIGAENAPPVAAFYLTHNGRFYVEKMHPVNLLLGDAQKLCTEWSTGKKMTGLEVKSAGQLDEVQEQVNRVRAMMAKEN